MTPTNPDASGEAQKLTPQQIDNWRNMLCATIGPYSLIISESEIEMMRQKFSNENNP